MRGPAMPPALTRASERMAKSKLWSVVHPHPAPSPALEEPEEAPAPEEEPAATPPAAAEETSAPGRTVRLGQRGAPVAAPRRTRR